MSRPRAEGQFDTVFSELDERSLLESRLIQCVRQPGKLRISRQACGLRYLKAREGEPKNPKTVFEMVRKHGLEICLTCPEGRLQAEEIVPQTSATKKRGAKVSIKQPGGALNDH